jgi:signal transduction histidine kinase
MVKRLVTTAGSGDDRKVLALDALSKLTRQFANQPDFHQLAEVLILTLTGQFTVTSVFAALSTPGSAAARPFYYATGKFRDHADLTELVRSLEGLVSLGHAGRPQRVEDMAGLQMAPDLRERFDRAEVKVLVPLLHDGALAGLIGLGPKITRRPFDDAELELIGTLANTITPLLVNSLLFLEIVNLKAWYLEILDSVKQGVFVFDGKERLRKVNDAGLKILRALHSAEVHTSGFSARPLVEVFPESIFPGWAPRLQQFRRATDQEMLDSLVARSKGGDRVYQVRLSVIQRQEPENSDLIVTLDDVTDQKENEHRLFDLQKFAEKGMMASSISHELNNFLALILGGVELAQMVMGMGSIERAHNSLEKIKKAVGRMERFTAGLMDYTRLNPQKGYAGLNAIVEDVLAFVSVQKRFNRIRVDSELARDLPELYVDSDQIAQLLLNLLNNAADAIAETEREDGQIKVKTIGCDGDVCLQIADNGVGIPDEVRDKLFHCQLTTKERGHGYGLVTCAQIIERHRGKIDIESTLGEGATFTICFPTVAEQPEETSPSPNVDNGADAPSDVSPEAAPRVKSKTD